MNSSKYKNKINFNSIENKKQTIFNLLKKNKNGGIPAKEKIKINKLCLTQFE